MIDKPIRHVIRDECLFAGLRKPIKRRDELTERIKAVTEICRDAIVGPLTHIFRYDTPVDGFDSEIGYPVSRPVTSGDVKTHTLRRLDFFSAEHRGSVQTISETSRRVYAYMNRVGLAPELEMVEIYHQLGSENEHSNRIEVQAAFLAWPEIYWQQLVRVLGEDAAQIVWAGGEAMTPHTLVDDRADWVAASLERLKRYSAPDQQFDILSRVALLRPAEDTAKYRAIYEQSGESIQAVLDAQNADLSETATGGWIDPPTYDGGVLHLSKVARDRAAYDAATSNEERRRAYCFCSLVREAKNPQIDPIFCFRAAGWARQFWEPILGVEFESCEITHSILAGDPFCAWDYRLP